jgi:bifunctional DNA-binding transcriptional regulator/antitoxin component of YhaV-PrlF toxin-antitoxin module
MSVIKLGKYKIQKIKRAYYIALPKKWVESKGLQKGSVLEAFLDDQGNLVFQVARRTTNGD